VKLAGASIALFVALVHCSSDNPVSTVCDIAFDGKTCSCKRERGGELGACGPLIVGAPAHCCAATNWPAEGTTCTCEEVVCATVTTGCVCGLASTRAKTDPSYNEVAECPTNSDGSTHCCLQPGGDCGCFPRGADQCQPGSTDVQTCNYASVEHTCATGTHEEVSCE
jgi:hypothetical protein